MVGAEEPSPLPRSSIATQHWLCFGTLRERGIDRLQANEFFEGVGGVEGAVGTLEFLGEAAPFGAVEAGEIKVTNNI